MMNPDGVYLGNYRGSLLGEFMVLYKKQCRVNDRMKGIINAEKLTLLKLWLFVNQVVVLEEME